MSFSFLTHNPATRYGILIDIGSGSIGSAIVASDPLEKLPKIIWSNREWIKVGDKFDDKSLEKKLTTAIFNSFLEIGNAGFAVLRSEDRSAKVESIQVNIAAPWSYTLTGTVSTQSENPFNVTSAFLKEFIGKARAICDEKLSALDPEAKIGLTNITKEIVSISINGYQTHKPKGQEGKDVVLSEINCFADKKLITDLESACDKLVPDIKPTCSSFMFSFYLAMCDLKPDTAEAGLIDVTSEATELGIIREGVLVHTTNMLAGANSLAREISAMSKVTIEEALSYFHSNGIEFNKVLSADKQAEIQVIIDSYVQELSELFKKTGDALSIPKTIFLHVDAKNEEFFADLIKRAAGLATNTTHNVHLITSKFFTEIGGNDTPLLLSAYVFHKSLPERDYLDD